MTPRNDACGPLAPTLMHGMKSLLSVFDIKTDRIYCSISANKRIGDRPLIVNVGFNRLKLRIIGIKQRLGPFQMS